MSLVIRNSFPDSAQDLILRHKNIIMLTGFITAMVAIYVGLITLLYLGQERLLYFPVKQIVADPGMIGLDFEAVQLTTVDDVRLAGWFVPAPNSDLVLLFFHGNGGNISHRLDSIEQFHRLGLNVLIIDYRGYGQSEGRTTEAGTYLDAEAAWRYLTQERGFSAEQIIIFGRSLGGAVAAALAEKHPPRLLILESTFTSVPEMAARQFRFVPARQLARIQYNTAARLPNIHVPLLIIHSPDDEVIPFDQGQALFRVANQPKQFLQITGGHNDGFLISAAQYEPTVAAFIEQHRPVNSRD